MCDIEVYIKQLGASMHYEPATPSSVVFTLGET